MRWGEEVGRIVSGRRGWSGGTPPTTSTRCRCPNRLPSHMTLSLRERERRQSETVLTLFQGSCRLSFAAPPPY